jgi:hypothetical protein
MLLSFGRITTMLPLQVTKNRLDRFFVPLKGTQEIHHPEKVGVPSATANFIDSL